MSSAMDNLSPRVRALYAAKSVRPSFKILREGRILRDITESEVSWIPTEDLERLTKDTIVTEYIGPTWGCGGLKDGKYIQLVRDGPFYEVPGDSVQWLPIKPPHDDEQDHVL